MSQSASVQAKMAEAVAALEKDWATNPRWKGIKRNYSAADVVRLRGTAAVEHTLAKKGSEKLWNLINTEPFINSLGALTGNQAMQQVKAGLKAIYLWLASRGRRQPRWRDVSGPIAVSGQLGAVGGSSHQQHADACRPDPVDGRQGRR